MNRLAIALVVALVASACAGTTGTPPERADGGTTITIERFAFEPARSVVPVGASVRWVNRDQILHTATAGTGPGTETGVFDGTMEEQGQTFTFEATRRGTFPYFCARHPEVEAMHGVLVVE